MPCGIQSMGRKEENMFTIKDFKCLRILDFVLKLPAIGKKQNDFTDELIGNGISLVDAERAVCDCGRSGVILKAKRNGIKYIMPINK